VKSLECWCRHLDYAWQSQSCWPTEKASREWARLLGRSRDPNDFPTERQSLRILLPVGDSLVGKIQKFRAAAAHLDGDVAQGGSLEFETGRLAMIRTPDGFQFAGGVLFKFLYRHPQSILA
jgi:hypothetical protein